MGEGGGYGCGETYGHRQKPRLGMLEDEVLVVKGLQAVDARRSRAIAIQEVAALTHEIFDLDSEQRNVSLGPMTLESSVCSTIKPTVGRLYIDNQEEWGFV